jgi:hypothetical protein
VAAVCSHHGAAAQGLASISGLASAATPKSRALDISSGFLAAYKLVGGSSAQQRMVLPLVIFVLVPDWSHFAGAACASGG